MRKIRMVIISALLLISLSISVILQANAVSIYTDGAYTYAEVFFGIIRRVHDGIINGCPGNRQPRDTVTVEISQGFEIMHVVPISIA